MSIRFAWSKSNFKSWIFLLVFCLINLSHIDSGVLKYPTIIVWESKFVGRKNLLFVSGCSYIRCIYI